MKKLSTVFGVLALVLSHLMCVNIAYDYRGMLCCIEHSLCSAPAYVVFYLLIPYGVGIAVCATISAVLYRKSRGGGKR